MSWGRNATVNYTYDGLNRLTQESQTGAYTFTNTYAYDDYSNRSQAALAGAATNYTYDANNRLVSTTGGEVASYTYDANGNMTQAVFGTGAGARTVSCVYDGFGRLKKVNDNGKETEYTYDADGLRSSKSAGGSTERYIYDNGQLVLTVVPAATSVYTGTIPASGYGSTTFGMAVGEQYFVEINGTMYSGTVRLDFGTAEAAMPYATSGDPSAGFGTFVILEAGDVTIVSPDGGVSGTISGPAGAQVKVYMGDPRKATTAYIRGLGLIASRTGSTPTYYHYDAHGNVIQTTDANGNLVKNYYYDAFGMEQNADPADTNPFRYCGEQYDAETGNYYLRARYYAPGVGRFTQEDPIRDGLNWYAYCGGNPVGFVDPSGLSENLLEALVEWFAGWINGMYDATAGEAGGFFAETITSPFKDVDTSTSRRGYDIGSKTTEFVLTHDVVYDYSVSGSVGNWGGTLGYSFIQGNASGYTADYIHVGGGYAPGILPISGSIGIGFVDDAPTPEDYEGFFVDGSISGLGGMEYCMWPGGASAMSITIGTNVSGGVRLDNYVLVKSQKSNNTFYELYKWNNQG